MATESTTTTNGPATGGIGTHALSGLAAGLAAGATWWAVETAANWALGGYIPADLSAMMLGLDLGIGAVAGLALGVVLGLAGLANAVTLALALTAVYGFLRVYEPPGFKAEALYAAAAGLAIVLGARIVGPRRGPLAFLHVLLVATVAIALGRAGAAEVQSTYFSHKEPSGAPLPLMLAFLPLAGLVVDRIVAVVLRRDVIRFAGELAVAVAAVLFLGRPLSTSALVDARNVAPAPAVGQPDVILISMDTTRADHMSTYGYFRENSPNLTKLAADGLNFTQARSPAQWTVPGHASMLTGMFPSRHGAHYSGGFNAAPAVFGRRRVFPLGDDKTTLAEVLRSRGYATAGFVANFANLYRGFGMAQGFQRYEDHPGLLLRPVPHAVHFVQHFDPAFCKRPFRSAENLNAAALAWMDEQAKDRPTFVFLNYLEPHHWLASPPYDKWAREVPGADHLTGKGLFTHKIPAGLTPDEQAFVTAQYDGQILAMDTALGELIDDLKRRGRYENTIIIVSADHGELLGEHDIVGHGGRMMYEGLLRIPLVVKLPGAEHARGVVNDQVQLVDIVPTVLTTIGVPVPGAVQGQPLQQVTRASLAEEHINPEFVAFYGDVYNRAMRVLYDPPYKLITTSRGERMLFDLADDPDEMHDLASNEPQRVTSMEGRLDAAMSGMESDVADAGREPRTIR